MASEPTNQRILSGMRSTNPRLHIGNYEGALRNWVDLQNQGFQMFCMVADWHALTTMHEESKQVGRNSREVAKDYVAAGIDPSKSVVFIQSHVKEHAELHLLLSMITPQGWLERVPTYKEKLRDLASENSPFAKLLDAALKIPPHRNALGDAFGKTIDKVLKEDQFLEVTGIEHIARKAFNELSGVSQTLFNLAKTESLDGDTRTDLTIAWQHLSGPVLSEFQPFAAGLVPSGFFGKIQTIYSHLFEIERILDKISSRVAQAPYGLLGYPVLQTADILLYRPLGVPVGKDQAPHLEIGNDIGARFNRLYDVELFTPYKYMIPEDAMRATLPGLDMQKMSKTHDNGIYLSDTEDETAAKIKSAFTTPTKLRKTDPGIPEGCAVCQYLRIYSKDWETQWQEDRDGLRGCMQNKKECTEAVNEYLRPIRERRAALDDATIEDILRDGAERARAVAADTMSKVRSAMGLT